MALLSATSSFQIASPASSKGFFGAAVSHNVTMVATSTKKVTPIATCALPHKEASSSFTSNPVFRGMLCGACVALTIATASPAFAKANARLPPLSTDPNRCERAFDGNTIGQANGVADKVLDLRGCDFSNDKTNLKGKTLSAALMSKANFDGADLTEVVMSKAYAVGASFRGTLFNNAVVDRVAFDESDMTGVQFINTVLSGSTFDNANLAESSFEDALIGYVDIQKVCRNETLPEEARIELACKR